MNEQKKQRLITAILKRKRELNDQIEEIKKEAEEIMKRDDWLWHLLLTSMATMGNSRGYQGLIKNLDNYERVAYNNLLELSDNEREETLKNTLKAAKVRMPETKAEWLFSNFTKIQLEPGGIEAIQSQLLSLPGKESKINFLQQFKGIGDKYARNMMMDIRHPDFMDSIAIDERIKDVSEELGILAAPPAYEDHEKYYLDIAKEAAITPWELDRLLYNNKDYFITAIK